jgi:hypothetical protein
MVIMLLKCVRARDGCGWIGPADERPRYDLETGARQCPECLGPVVEWPVDQAREQWALHREQAAVKAQWQKEYQKKEDALAAERIASDGAKMRARATADVIARHGGGRYAREERQHLQELIARVIAEREGGMSDG